MEYIQPESMDAKAQIMCCECGTLIEPNPSNMCVGCLRTNVDISEGIPKQAIIYFCRGCDRYMQQQGQWVFAEIESRELLSLCLKKLKGLTKVNLVDASFVWTEPHSKRIKVKLTIQKEVMGGAILQQIFVVEFVVHGNYCTDCHRREAKDFWRAMVQIRQNVAHKKTFYYLEQLLLKHKAHSNCVNVIAKHDGLDFYFDKKDDARKLVDFLQSVVPCRYITSQRLISHDTHSNTYNYKYTYSVEVIPICKDDVVCLPYTLAQSLGNIGQICIVLRVTNQLYLIDPFSLKTAELSSQNYFRYPFRALCSSKQLTEYTVMNIELIDDKSFGKFSGHRSEKHVLADVWLVKTNELGISDEQIHTKTHLGHLLKPGDSVLSFGFSDANLNDSNLEKYEKKHDVPDAIIVKKHYGDKAVRNRKRQWKLKRIQIDEASDGTSANHDFNDFMEDLEEDPISRINVNIYKDNDKMKNMMAVDTDEIGDDIPEITLQEMLDDLNLEQE